MTEPSASVFSASDSHSSSLCRVLPSLESQDVHLWLCARDRVASSDDFKRRVLSHYADVAPGDWQFVVNAQGKPALAGATPTLDFNLSHSGDWLACAVTAGTPVGVDIEYCHPNRATLKLARRFFRPEEVTALQACSELRQRDQFYDLWTLKEAAVKARGQTLVPGLQARGFALSYPVSPEIESGRIAAITADVADTAHYCLLDPLADYRVAICWLPMTPLLPRLQVFELRERQEVMQLVIPLRARSSLD